MATTNPYDDDHLHEECAIFGIYGSQDAAAHTALGLHALQHRGQEAAGIVAAGTVNFPRIASWASSAISSAKRMS